MSNARLFLCEIAHRKQDVFWFCLLPNCSQFFQIQWKEHVAWVSARVGLKDRKTCSHYDLCDSTELIRITSEWTDVKEIGICTKDFLRYINTCIMSVIMDYLTVQFRDDGDA